MWTLLCFQMWHGKSYQRISWVVGKNSPMHNWPKKARQQTAQMQLSKPEVRSSAQLISVSIRIVMGALLGWYEDTGLNSLMPFIIRHNHLLPCHNKPLYWCSLFIAKIFTPMVFPMSQPAYVEAHTMSMSSLARRISSSWMPSPLQKEIYSHKLPKSFIWVVLLRVESSTNSIFLQVGQIWGLIEAGLGVGFNSYMADNNNDTVKGNHHIASLFLKSWHHVQEDELLGETTR